MCILRVGLSFEASVLTQESASGALRSLDVLLFPELMDGGYAAIRQGAAPHTSRHRLVRTLREVSKRNSMCIIGGSLYFEDDGSPPMNTSLSFQRGRLVHRYDKVHLFTPTGDRELFSPGKPIAKTFKLTSPECSLRAGVVICYDLRFPELIRAMALQGMKILFVPARWPAVRDDAWQALLKARAIENQIFVVGCDSSDDEGGYSYAFDPLGTMLYSSRNAGTALVHKVDLDLGKLEEAAKLHQNLKEAVFLRRYIH